MEYELFYLIGASKEAEVEEIKKEAEGIVEQAGGKFLEKTTVEKRRLSYEVKHETHGIYIARRFELEDGEAIQKITKNLNLNGNVLRFIISRAQDLPQLLSKEERMEEAAKEKKAEKTKEVKKPRETKKKEAEKNETKEAKKEQDDSVKNPEEEGKKETADSEEEKNEDEDIDKKLEEILNI